MPLGIALCIATHRHHPYFVLQARAKNHVSMRRGGPEGWGIYSTLTRIVAKPEDRVLDTINDYMHNL